MRSLSLFAVAALVAALVSGPVLAQEAFAPVAPASEVAAPAADSASTVKAKKHHVKKHHAKKHHAKKSHAADSVTVQ